mmetsp:Transcript_13860/g.31203  ORF Transcript_13860/g.31203 Transcript_13860/m.31203 type:complete len:533 (+) Transcript_13860:49-1647(+)
MELSPDRSCDALKAASPGASESTNPGSPLLQLRKVEQADKGPESPTSSPATTALGESQGSTCRTGADQTPRDSPIGSMVGLNSSPASPASHPMTLELSPEAPKLESPCTSPRQEPSVDPEATTGEGARKRSVQHPPGLALTVTIPQSDQPRNLRSRVAPPPGLTLSNTAGGKFFNELEECNSPVNAVSILQEYVQSRCPFTPHQKILTWSFESNTSIEGLILFRGSVEFTLGEKYHHITGDWQGSKKKAQRDAGEQALLELRKDGAPLAPPPPVAASPTASVTTPTSSGIDGPIAELHCFVREQSQMSSNEKVLNWTYEASNEHSGSPSFRATVSFQFKCLPQQFRGRWQSSKKKAQKDAATRVIWYFKASGGAALPVSEQAGSPMGSPAGSMISRLLQSTGGAGLSLSEQGSPLGSPAASFGMARLLQAGSPLGSPTGSMGSPLAFAGFGSPVAAPPLVANPYIDTTALEAFSPGKAGSAAALAYMMTPTHLDLGNAWAGCEAGWSHWDQEAQVPLSLAAQLDETELAWGY